MELFKILEKFGFTTSKAMVDVYYKKHSMRIAHKLPEALKLRILENKEVSWKILRQLLA